MDLKNTEVIERLLDVLRAAGVESFASGDFAVRFAPQEVVTGLAPFIDPPRTAGPPTPSWMDVKFPGESS